MASAPANVEAVPLGVAAPAKFSVQHQDVELDLDFATRTIRGKASIFVEPLQRDLREVQFCCREMDITSVKVDSRIVPNYKYTDPFDVFSIRQGYTVHQHHWIQEKFDNQLIKSLDQNSLTIPLPAKYRIVPSSETGRLTLRLGNTSFANSTEAPADDGTSKYRPFTVVIEYEKRNIRDGFHWVGLDKGDNRYPHAYTYSNSLAHTLASYLFPCVEDSMVKCTWKLSVICPRTLGDLHLPARDNPKTGQAGVMNGHVDGEISTEMELDTEPTSVFSEEEKALEISIVCSGYMEDSDAPIDLREHRRKWVFNCSTPVLPRHVGFAIGPFEQVDLSQYRESEQDDKMGQSAVSVHGFCLPGRADEVRNTCMPLASALDKLSTSFVFYPFESQSSSYKVCFVDDLPMNVVDTATLSICSSRLLVPENILDPLYDSTRELMHAVASQWLGVKVTAKYQEDSWLIIGGSYFMADWCMTTLWGRNEQRFRLKLAADKIHELDVKKPALYFMGSILEVDPEELEFVKLKAPLVLSILHNRILKANGRIGVNRALSRVLLDDQVGKLEDGLIDTERFMKACEKVSHGKVDAFFQQWVYGAGCPTFRISQRFNKKKLVVEMLILQTQGSEQASLSGLSPSTFMREAKEEEEDIRRGPIPPLFTGPMTIRIHEADGTPYEHIVDIKELSTKVEIQYNTKYKRLKRNRRAKERAAAAAGVDVSGDPQDDSLLYCLGDVLQSDEEIRVWNLSDWTKDDEDRMSNEHFEWIRLDKDFEWIAKITFNQPHYMWVSQLQQDNDVVAQTESLQYLMGQQPFPLVSTILTRTILDARYFYGIRLLAIQALVKCAIPELKWIGLTHLEKTFHEFFCFEGSNMTRSNDFSDLRQYKIQCAIPEAISQVRDSNGRAPDRVKRFFLDALKFNDNSNNDYSDSFYVATLMSSLAKSLLVVGGRPKPKSLSYEDLEMMTEEQQEKVIAEERMRTEQEERDGELQRAALEEIQRFRRIDQWIPSYQNLYTVTALESIKSLMENGAMQKVYANFLHYTRIKHSAPVRLKAFDCLVDLGIFPEPAVMCYFIANFFEESSPYFRSKLWKIIGRGFAQIALMEIEEPKPKSEPAIGGLVVESAEKSEEARRTHLAKTQTIDGAIGVLKERVGQTKELQDVLLEALKSPKVGIDQFLDLLTLCRMLYEPRDSLLLKLRLPPYYKATHTGDGKVTFKSTRRYRTKPFTQWEQRRPKSLAPPPQPKRPHADIMTPTSATPREAGTSEAKRPRISDEPTSQQPVPPLITVPSIAAHAIPIPAPIAAPIPHIKKEAGVSPPPNKKIKLSLNEEKKPTTPRPSKRKSKLITLKLSRSTLRRFPAGAFGSSPAARKPAISITTSASIRTSPGTPASAKQSSSKSQANGANRVYSPPSSPDIPLSSQNARSTPAPVSMPAPAPPLEKKKPFGLKLKLKLGPK